MILFRRLFSFKDRRLSGNWERLRRILFSFGILLLSLFFLSPHSYELFIKPISLIFRIQADATGSARNSPHTTSLNSGYPPPYLGTGFSWLRPREEIISYFSLSAFFRLTGPASSKRPPVPEFNRCFKISMSPCVLLLFSPFNPVPQIFLVHCATTTCGGSGP